MKNIPVYLMYDRQMQLLRVSTNPLVSDDWATEVAAMKLVWYTDIAAAHDAISDANERFSPKYYQKTFPNGQCPRCKGPKQRRYAAYCNVCYRVYHARRNAGKRAAKAAPDVLP